MAISNILFNLLNGISNASDARKKLSVPRANVSDDSMSVEYDQANDRVIVAHTEDDSNISQIQADSRGVWYHKNVAGSWTTVPQAVNVGGTGATNAANARINLGIALNSGSQTGVGVQMEAASWVSGGSTTMEFTIPTNFNLNNISTVNLTSLKIVPRGINGYVDNMSSTLTEMVGKSDFTITATKVNNYAISVKIVKSSAMANCTNNTPVTISYTYTATVT